MNYSFINREGDNVKGWLSEEEAEILYDYALKAPTSRILELGSFVGRSSLVLASAMKKRQGILICLDYFGKEFIYKNQGIMETIPDVFDEFWNNINERHLENYVITLSGDYKIILPTLGGGFGLVFIDGGHNTENTMFAATDAWQRLDDNGFVIFHDYNNVKWPDVKTCVDKLKNRWKKDFVKQSKNSNLVILKK